MKKILVLTAAFALGLILLSGYTLHAAQATRVLQPGHTYEFVGTDPRVVSHINIQGLERYEFVELNAQDEIQSFGFSNWRISVSGMGRTLVTPLSPLNVSFDSSRLELNVTEGSVLHRVNVSKDSSVRILNNGLPTLHVRLNQTMPYDFVITNRLDNIENYGTRTRFPQLGIPGNGALLVHATEGDVTVYFPSWWYNNVIETEVVDFPALVSLQVEADSVYEFHNMGTEALNITAEPMYENVDFHFQYVVRGRDGHVIRSGDATGAHIGVSPGEMLLLTPLIDANVVFPYVLAEYVVMSIGEAASLYQPLLPGESVTVINTSATRTHNVFVGCSRNSGDFGFDHVILVDGEISFVVHENVALARATIPVPPGGTLSITATYAERNLEVFIPDSPEITYHALSLPVVTRNVLRPGQSVYLSNSGETEARVLVLSSIARARFDYLVIDNEDNGVVDFGQGVGGDEFVIRAGESVHFTSVDHTITVNIPRATLDQGLIREPRREQALHHIMLTGEEGIKIENVDRRYNHLFLAIDAGTRQVRHAPYAYEFVTENRRGAVLLYGMNSFGMNTLAHLQSIRLMPGSNREVLVMFPAKWYGSVFRLATVSEQPLFRLTLTPGSSLTLNNPSRDDFSLANNSYNTAAGFYVRVTGQAATDSSVTTRIGSDDPESGDIIVPARSEVRIIAAAGEDLEIWMPREWAQILGLLRR